MRAHGGRELVGGDLVFDDAAHLVLVDRDADRRAHRDVDGAMGDADDDVVTGDPRLIAQVLSERGGDHAVVDDDGTLSPRHLVAGETSGLESQNENQDADHDDHRTDGDERGRREGGGSRDQGGERRARRDEKGLLAQEAEHDLDHGIGQGEKQQHDHDEHGRGARGVGLAAHDGAEHGVGHHCTRFRWGAEAPEMVRSTRDTSRPKSRVSRARSAIWAA